MFKTRLLSGIVLVIILIATVGCGGEVLFGVLGVISLIGMTELYKVVGVQKKPIAFAGYLVAVAYYALLYTNRVKSFAATDHGIYDRIDGSLCIFVSCICSRSGCNSIFWSILCGNDDVLCISDKNVRGWWHCSMAHVYLSSWGCDTCAYCVGMLIGKHKMAPKLSPKKSVEGGIGGIVGAALLGAILCSCNESFCRSTGKCVALCNHLRAAGGAISQIGDLAASAIKRNHDIKDYGTLIPGHGGILDRFDSVLFTAPVIYFLTTFLAGNL